MDPENGFRFSLYKRRQLPQFANGFTVIIDPPTQKGSDTESSVLCRFSLPTYLGSTWPVLMGSDSDWIMDAIIHLVERSGIINRTGIHVHDRLTVTEEVCLYTVQVEAMESIKKQHLHLLEIISRVSLPLGRA